MFMLTRHGSRHIRLGGALILQAAPILKILASNDREGELCVKYS